ncbi:hypothetical protein C5688_13690 [Methylocystis sp. MitZ-2018]|nr:hypothetical protein C5688_13690 [Methylocystis sp. MitZ-2018]
MAQEVPKFTQFPAAIYRGGTRLNLSTPQAYSFRTRLREAASGPINFGGHYQLAMWGCGTDCTTGAFIDATTGRVTFLPTVNTYEMRDIIDDAFKPIEYRLRSRLIVFAGQLNETGASGWHFYAVDRGELLHVLTKPYRAAGADAKQDARQAVQGSEGSAASSKNSESSEGNDVPRRVGQCVETEIASLGSRLEGVPDSGSAISYANGIVGVSYDVVEAVRRAQVGDKVTLCLVSVPSDCPKGDDRGKVYSAVNKRTGQGWSLPDASHMCGGA